MNNPASHTVATAEFRRSYFLFWDAFTKRKRTPTNRLRADVRIDDLTATGKGHAFRNHFTIHH